MFRKLKVDYGGKVWPPCRFLSSVVQSIVISGLCSTVQSDAMQSQVCTPSLGHFDISAISRLLSSPPLPTTASVKYTRIKCPRVKYTRVRYTRVR